MTLNEIDHNSSPNPQFSKSNYHSQLSKSLFRHYNRSAQALQKSGSQTPDFVYQEPKLLNQQEFVEYHQEPVYGTNGNGYFVDRGAISVPSSRIETFYTDKSIEEEVHNIMHNYEVLHNYDQSVDVPPLQHGDDGYRLSSNHQYDENVQPVYQEELHRDYQNTATQPQYQNHVEYNVNQDPQNLHFISQHHYPHQQPPHQYHEQLPVNNLHQQQAAHRLHSYSKQVHPEQYENVQSSFPPTFNQPYNSHHIPSQATQFNNLHKQSNFQYPSDVVKEPNEAQHLPKFSQATQLNVPANKDMANFPHGLSTTKETTFEPKTKAKRGRPRKKPGFHLKLDGINKKVNLPNRLVSSSQSDSGTDYWNRTPGGVSHGPLRLSMTLTREDFDVKRDMQLNEGTMYESVPSFNLTPSVEPPAKSYFELDHTPGIDTVASGSYFSPAAGFDGGVNNFNQSFEIYLNKGDHFLNTQHEEIVDSNLMGFPIPEFREEDAGEGHQEPIKEEFTPLGLSVDPYMSQNESSPGKTSGADVDNYSQSTYSADIPQFNIDQYINSDEDHEVYPTVNQTLSNHSSPHSATSIGSEVNKQEPTTKSHAAPKKKTSKGAHCPVCDKFISRDLTRHMRIHNEIGRFQCVYPREMCNHKTQNFNRPYDYKKHLLHLHFKFDDARGKTAHTLGDKLPLSGECVACGARYIASEWLSEHVLTRNEEHRCAYVDARALIEQS